MEIKRFIGEQAIEARIFVLGRAQSLRIAHLQIPVHVLPEIASRPTEAVATRKLRPARLRGVLLQDGDHQLGRKPRLRRVEPLGSIDYEPSWLVYATIVRDTRIM
jgi:hypothetical protein